MNLSVSYSEGVLNLYLSGELDHHEVKQSMTVIENLLTDHMPRECVLDLGRLSFMDSSCIALILRLDRQMSEIRGHTWVENPSGQPLRVIDASGIDRIVKITATKGAET